MKSIKVTVYSNGEVFIPDRLIGFVGEDEYRQIEFEYPTITGAQHYKMRIEYDDGLIYEVPIINGIANIGGSILREAGKKKAQFVAYAYDDTTTAYTMVMKSKIFEVIIGEAIGNDVVPIPSYDAIMSAVTELVETGMTREQVITAIDQIISTGEVQDLDTGFVTTLKEINHGLPFRVWLGTTTEYQTLAEAGLLEAGVLYLRSDDTSAEEIRAAIAALQAAAAELQAKTADTGWKTLSIIDYPTEWTVGTPAPKYRKIGNHVYVKGQVRINLDEMYDPDTGSEDITTIFATLPEGYRPATSFYKLIPNQGDRMARLYVRSASASGDPGGMNINYLKDYSGTPIKSGTVWIQIDCDFLTN